MVLVAFLFGHFVAIATAAQSRKRSDSKLFVPLMRSGPLNAAGQNAEFIEQAVGGDGEGSIADGGAYGNGPDVHLLAFRSCSQDPLASCNQEFYADLSRLSQVAAKVPSITKHHLFYSLPPKIETNPKWSCHVVEGIRGRGWWFWKPALLNLLVENGTVRDGDIVVWQDADEGTPYFNLDASTWSKALSQFVSGRLDIFAMNMPFCEYRWTKEDIFARFNTSWQDPYYGLSYQAHAQFVVVSINQRTRKFMNHWEDLMADWQLVSDDPSGIPNSGEFNENRHDQSILSMLMKANLASRSAVNAGEGELGRPLREGETCKTPTDFPERHPEFGIRNLRAHVGNFKYLVEEIEDPGEKTQKWFR